MRAQILSEIRRLAHANAGQPPGQRSFESETGIRASKWKGVFWARWGEALAEAGFDPNPPNIKTDETVMLRKIAEAFRQSGRILTQPELQLYRKRDAEFPPLTTIKKSFPTRARLLARLAEWTMAEGNYGDVAEILEPAVGSSLLKTQARAKEGLVYLLRSGAHYKIGRSDEIERRVKEIRIALPESATLVHTIRTDDPSGIEAYWHRRFEARRANGEWFKLTSSDVAAFKRRNYQ